MPGMSGAELARTVRGIEGLAATPIVMLTSVDQSLSGFNQRELAIDAHLTKPARSSALLEALVSTIQKHRSGAARSDAAPASVPERAEEEPVRAPAFSLRARSDGEHKVDILVAEDNEVNQLVFSQILGETQHSFRIVPDGRKALQAVAELKPRMILMDVSMPEMNGIEATAAIRAGEASSGTRIPIVGVTAHALKGDRERCLEAGMDDYLPKPISPRALLEKVGRWIGRDEAAGSVSRPAS
jgi:CheY-like chemotaxis protein